MAEKTDKAPIMNIFESFKLNGRRAVVTGSSRGIGAAIAVGLAEAGADVAIHYTGNYNAANDVANRIIQLGKKSIVIQADLSQDGGADKIYEEATEAMDGIDILISNVSIQIPEPWNEIEKCSFDRQVLVNLRSSLELIQLVAPAMMEQKWGRILTIGSVQESLPHPDMLVYSSLKAAQTHMSKNLSKQFAASGVTVNNLAPGVINTDRSRGRLEVDEYREKVLAKIPVGNIGMAEDCVGAALLLCSDAGRYITGQNLFVDGGMSI